MSRGSIRAGVGVVAALLALAGACSGGSAEPIASPLEPPSASIAPAPTSRPPSPEGICEAPGSSTLAADVDGDGREDVAYHLSLDAGPVLGVCTAAGEVSERRGAGMTELFSVLDVEPDGRDELLYGGTSVSQGFLAVAVFLAGRLVEVRDGIDPLVLVDGSRFLGSTVEVDEAWGCEDVDQDGARELVVVRLDWRRLAEGYSRRTYHLDGASAVIVSDSVSRIGSDVVREPGAASRLVEPC